MDNTKELTAISFCAGYGGIERGLELAGVRIRVVAYVEIEAFAIANLVAKMESGELAPAPIYTDLKTFPAKHFRGKVGIFLGGYPCQPFSVAGNGLGKEDPRHLWPYLLEHIKAVNPVRCLWENVTGHINRGLEEVIEDMEGEGYRTTWGIFSAAEVGAKHRRERIFILGNSEHDGLSTSEESRGTVSASDNNQKGSEKAIESTGASEPGGVSDIFRGEQLADSDCERLQRCEKSRGNGSYGQKPNDKQSTGCYPAHRENEWPPEPDVGRVAHGVANRIDRLRMLGNGVVPQTACRAWQVLSKRLENENDDN